MTTNTVCWNKRPEIFSLQRTFIKYNDSIHSAFFYTQIRSGKAYLIPYLLNFISMYIDWYMSDFPEEYFYTNSTQVKWYIKSVAMKSPADISPIKSDFF